MQSFDHVLVELGATTQTGTALEDDHQASCSHGQAIADVFSEESMRLSLCHPTVDEGPRS